MRSLSLVLAAVATFFAFGLSWSTPELGVGNSVGTSVKVGRSRAGVGIGARAVTSRLLVRDSRRPLTTADAADSGAGWIYADEVYDTITEAGDGTAIRWGCIYSAAPTTPTFNINGGYSGRATEYDGGPASYYQFFAFNLSEIPAGSRIDSAYIYLPAWRFGTADVSTGSFFVRGDTVAADYAMLESVADTGSGGLVTNDDLNWLNTSYNEVNIDASTAWSPALSARDDWNDWGPRSDDTWNYTENDSIPADVVARLSVREAIQQIKDRGHTWAIFVAGQIGTPSFSVPWTYGIDAIRAPYGTPALSVVWTDRRGTKPWDTGQVPFSLVFDVVSPSDGMVSFYDPVDSAGYELSLAVTGSEWDATEDSLAAAIGLANIDFLQHTRTHPLLVGLTDQEISYQLARDWCVSTVGFSAADTSGILDFVWPGGADPRFSWNAIKQFVRNGYRTARAMNYRDNTESMVGESTFASWDEYVNLFMVQARLMSPDFLASSSQADLEDEILDYVDNCWTNYGRAAAIGYSHGWSDNNTPQKTRWLLNIVADHDFITWRPYSWIMNRLASRPWVDPATVTEANGATATTAAAAARYDSLASADGVAWTDSVWVGPK